MFKFQIKIYIATNHAIKISIKILSFFNVINYNFPFSTSLLNLKYV